MAHHCGSRKLGSWKNVIGLFKQVNLNFSFLSKRSLSIPLREPEQEQLSQDVKPFNEIPGPLSLPVIGTLYLYSCGIYSFEKLYESGMKKYLKYGKIVREEIVPGENTVWIFDPEDYKQLILYETTMYPARKSHLAVEKFRKSRPEVYSSGGLLSTNGEEWWKLRREFQKDFSAPQAVKAYLPATDRLIREFVTRQLLYPCDFDFMIVLSRLSLQLTSLIAFDEEFDSFSTKELGYDSRTSKLIEAAFTSNHYGYMMDRVGFQTRLWKKFSEASLFMESVAVELVKKKKRSIAKPLEDSKDYVPSLLELYLTSPSMNYKDVVGMTVDLLLAGVETTAYTASFALYHLSKNERVQDILRMEARSLLQSPNQNITPEILSDARYARAILKEVFRMSPISVGVGRLLSEDIVLSGYHIPKGTNVVTQNQVSCRLDKNFVHPSVFLPERWMEGSPVYEKSNPYLVLPFGHGRRACIARYLAEQQLLTLLLRVVRDHIIEWKSDKPLGCKAMPINKPDQIVSLSFIKV